MGIKNLHKLLEKYSKDCYKPKHLSEYSYRKVAIDISLYLYKYKAIAGSRWLESFINLVNSLRKHDIHCVFVYDGQAPIEKLEEQKRRRDSRENQSKKIVELERQINDFEKHGIIGSLIEELCENKVKSLFRQQVIKNYNINLAKVKLETMKSMLISISPQDVQLTKDLFDVMKIPYIQAPQEAENFCSHLCVYGKVDFVLSEDTDVIAYGSPIFLTKIDTLNDTVVEISYDKILEGTSMTRETFTDLCIMCECDYNSNIYLIGPEKSYNLLKAYENIESVLSHLKTLKNKDGTSKYTDDMFLPLKYKRCREMFKIEESCIKDVYIPYCDIPDFNDITNFFFTHSIRYNIEKLKKNCTRELIFDYNESYNDEPYESNDTKDTNDEPDKVYELAKTDDKIEFR
jgi:5'-3' exonuclease